PYLLLMLRPARTPPLFPYTTLFRSVSTASCGRSVSAPASVSPRGSAASCRVNAPSEGVMRSNGEALILLEISGSAALMAASHYSLRASGPVVPCLAGSAGASTLVRGPGRRTRSSLRFLRSEEHTSELQSPYDL